MSLRVLMRGVVGPDVQAWQVFLAAQGINPDPIDGIFGPKTRQATIAIQARHGLDPDGIVGKNTFAKSAEFGFAFQSRIEVERCGSNNVNERSRRCKPSSTCRWMRFWSAT